MTVIAQKRVGQVAQVLVAQSCNNATSGAMEPITLKIFAARANRKALRSASFLPALGVYKATQSRMLRNSHATAAWPCIFLKIHVDLVHVLTVPISIFMMATICGTAYWKPLPQEYLIKGVVSQS